jgi:opacity protein-like surface antigen
MRRALLAALAALLLLPAAAAAAPDTIVDFEGIPDNTQVVDQYASSGVRFGPANQFGFPQPTNSCGAPYASSPGVSGTSARIDCRTGSTEFPTRYFGTAIEFATERRAVSFKLFQKTDDAPQTATISAYAIGGTLLDRHTVSLARNQVVSQTFSHSTTDGGIVGIVIQGDLDMYDSSGVFLDDVDATLDDVPPPKKFSLALTTPSINVVEGGSASSTLSVRRYNGSTGPVSL